MASTEEDDVDREAEMMESIPLPGNPQTERQWKTKLLALPRRAQIAIRRLHRNFRHMPNNALVQVLQAAHAPKDYIDAAKLHRCTACEEVKPIPNTHKAAPPKPYEFNPELGLDVFEIKDANGTTLDILNCVICGTTFEQGLIVQEAQTNGDPSSFSCLRKFAQGWVETVRMAEACRMRPRDAQPWFALPHARKEGHPNPPSCIEKSKVVLPSRAAKP